MKTTTNIVCGLAVGLVAASCGPFERRPYEDHCANQNGDSWCADKYGDGSRPFCSRGIVGCEAEIALNSGDRDGCIAERPADDACYSPCGGRMSVGEDAACLEGMSSSSGSESSGGTTMGESSGSGSESSTTGPMPCVSDEDCTDAAAPFCGTTGECGTCDGTIDPNGACAGLNLMMPLCVGEACVECTAESPQVCDEQLLLCDDASNTCVPCEAHDECESGACELAVGRCFAPDVVVHVDGDGGQDFTTVVAAVNDVVAGGFGVVVVHEQDSGLGYPGARVDGGKTIALLAAPGESPILQGTGGNAGLRVEGAGTTAYVDGLEVSLAAMGAVGLRVNGALAWVDRSRIVQNSGGGIVAEANAELILRNSFVGSLGDVIGVEVISASATVLYSTVTASTFGATPALGCTTPVMVDIRNSIVVSQGGTPPDELACAAASVTDSATEMSVGAFNLGWFTNYNAGDFSLSATGATAFADVAMWTTGDPPTDIDGDPRPAVNDTPDYAGADVP